MSKFQAVMLELSERLEQEKRKSSNPTDANSKSRMSEETVDFLLENLPAATTLYIMTLAKYCISFAQVVDLDIDVLHLEESKRSYQLPMWAPKKEEKRAEIAKRIEKHSPTLTNFFKKYQVTVPGCSEDLKLIFEEFGCPGIFTEFGETAQFATMEKSGSFPTLEQLLKKLDTIGYEFLSPIRDEILLKEFPRCSPCGGERLLNELGFALFKLSSQRNSLLQTEIFSKLDATIIGSWVLSGFGGPRIFYTSNENATEAMYTALQMLAFYSRENKLGELNPQSDNFLTADAAFYELRYLETLAKLPEELKLLLKILDPKHTAKALTPANLNN